MLSNAVDLEEKFNHFSIISVPEFSDHRLNEVVESQLVLHIARAHSEQSQVLVAKLPTDRWGVHQPPEAITYPLPWAPGCVPRLHVIRTFNRKKVEHISQRM